jgi:hypothetical protein
MAQNKTKQTKVSAAKYIAEIGDEVRRVDAKALVKLLQEITGEKPAMWGPSIVGFGSYHYKYDSAREGDMPLIGFSPRKPATVLYGATGFDGSDALLAKLGKHSMGKGCLYIKSLTDIDAAVLKKLLAKAVAGKRAKTRS